MNIVAFGGGVNSTAMLIGMYNKKIPVDLILFADTGAERPHTYYHINEFNEWLRFHNMPSIITIKYTKENGEYLTLEQECLDRKTLPAIAFGSKTCSLKYKKGVQDKFCNNYAACLETWKNKEKINRYVGYDAGEETRKINAQVYDMLDKKYSNIYPLIDWNWYRDDCVRVIKYEGLEVPKKSSCFFCPSMKKREIIELKNSEPLLFERAVFMEQNATNNLITVKGLGRNYAWSDFIHNKEIQVGMCGMEEIGTPCGCYDGD